MAFPVPTATPTAAPAAPAMATFLNNKLYGKKTAKTKKGTSLL